MDTCMNGVGTIFSNFLPEISLTSAINTAPLNDIAVKEIIPRRQNLASLRPCDEDSYSLGR